MRLSKWFAGCCLALVLATAPGCACMWDCVFPPPGPMVRAGVHEVYRGSDTSPAGYLVGACTFNAQGTMVWLVRQGYGEPPLLPDSSSPYTWVNVAPGNMSVPTLCSTYKPRLMQGDAPNGEPDRWNVTSTGIALPDCP